MKRMASALLLLALASSACTKPFGLGTGSAGGPGADADRLAIYETALRHLASLEGHRFFERLFIDTHTCPGAGSPMRSNRGCATELTPADQAALLGALSDIGPIRFVSEPKAISDRIFHGRLPGAALLRVGPISGSGDRVEVPASAYCGGLCGHWMTLVIERRGGGWKVTGTTGPTPIS